MKLPVRTGLHLELWIGSIVTSRLPDIYIMHFRHMNVDNDQSLRKAAGLVSRVSWPRRSHARALPSLNLKKTWDFSWSTLTCHFLYKKIKYLLFISDKKVEKRPVTFGKAGTAATMLCICHSPTDDLCFSGSDTGLVYVWQGTTLRRSVQAHNGPVCSMYSLSQTNQQVGDEMIIGKSFSLEIVT